MLTIKLSELEKHRNETTFRPYLEPRIRNLFWDIGIKFVVEGNADMTWVGHASYQNKLVKLEDSVSWGINKIKKYYPGDVILFDGKDSPSLMGSWEVFKGSGAKLLFKNSLYSDLNLYKTESVHGRIYWGSNKERDYSIQDDVSEVKLTGTNWLSTVTPQWFRYQKIQKDYDVCALFSFPAKEDQEFKVHTNIYYDQFRQKLFDYLPKGLKIARLGEDGKKLPAEQYYNLMQRSKLIIAPFGYGEIAPRDLEAAMFGSILIKNDMSHVNTIPNVYKPFETYIPCKWDFSDLEQQIEYGLEDWEAKREFFVENFRKEFTEKYKPENLVFHTHDWITNLEGYGTE